MGKGTILILSLFHFASLIYFLFGVIYIYQEFLVHLNYQQTNCQVIDHGQSPYTCNCSISCFVPCLKCPENIYKVECNTSLRQSDPITQCCYQGCSCSVNCATCYRPQLAVIFDCNGDHNSCCNTKVDIKGITDYQIGDIFDCYYDTTTTNPIEGCPWTISIDWTWYWWLGVVLLPAEALFYFKLLTCCLIDRFGCRRKKRLSSYIIIWWIILIPFGGLFPLLFISRNRILTDNFQFVILNLICWFIGLSMWLLTLITKPRKVNWVYPVLSGLFLCLSCLALPFLIDNINNWGMVWISFPICLFITGILISIWSCRYRLVPVYENIIKNNFVTANELGNFIAIKKSTFDADMLQFVNNPLFSDLSIIASDGIKLYAHQIIFYAITPHFYQYIMKEKSSNNEIEMQWPSTTLLTLLNLIYTGEAVLPNKKEERDDLITQLITIENSHKLELLIIDIEAYLENTKSRLKKKFVSINDKNIIIPFEDLIKRIETVLHKTKLTDAVFIFDSNYKIPIHKIFFAARSPYYHSELARWESETHEHRTRVPIEVFAGLKEYFYTDQLTEKLYPNDIVWGILEESLLMLLPKLQSICEKILASRLNDKNVRDYLELADKYNIRQLHYACDYYLAKRDKMADRWPLLYPKLQIQESGFFQDIFKH